MSWRVLEEGFSLSDAVRLPVAYRGECVTCKCYVVVPPTARPGTPTQCRCGARYAVAPYGGVPAVWVEEPRADDTDDDPPSTKRESVPTR